MSKSCLKLKYENLINHKSDCKDFSQYKQSFLLMEHQQTKEKRLIRLSCNKILVCYPCADKYLQEKSATYKSLISSLFAKYPKLKIGHLVLTLNHKSILHKKELLFEFFKLGNEFIKTQFKDAAIISALHSWSSSNPEKPHYHIHFLIIFLDKNSNYLNYWIDLDNLKYNWENFLNTSIIGYSEPENDSENFTKGFDKTKLQNNVLYYQYYQKKDIKQIKHKITYLFRSPIIDYVKDFGKTILSREYLENINNIAGKQRFRFLGWLSNSQKKKNLAKMGISTFSRKICLLGNDWKVIERCKVIREYEKQGKFFVVVIDSQNNHIHIESSNIYSSNFLLKYKTYHLNL